jgi:xylulokinase
MNADAPRPARAADRPGVACALGLDLGTSSAKAVVIDTEGTVLSQASAGYAVTAVMAGYAESDPGDWWNAVTACAREAVYAAGTRPAAIGLSGQMHGLVLTSPEGAALRPALLWADGRAAGVLRAYRHLGPRALARLANPLAPGMAGPLLVWLAQNEPRAYRDARWALQPKDWLRARLTGEFHAEPSDASATLLYDLAGDHWDLETVSALGLDASMLAPLLPSAGALAGRLSPQAAAELGLPAGLPVAAGAADTAAAALGSGVVSGDDVQLTVGTGAQVIRPVATAVSRADAGVNLHRSAAPAGWYHMGATLSAGLSLNWVRQVMNATWDELYASAGQPGQALDPIFVPHLGGERTPYSDPALRGSWTGLSLADDRTSLLRCALEGTAFAIRDALDALLAGHRPPRLRLAGGGTLAAGWRQLLADVLGLPLYAVDVPAASGRGAALLGARAAGLLSFADIQGPLAPPARLVAEPDPAAAAFHAERHARFLRVVAALGPGFGPDFGAGPGTGFDPTLGTGQAPAGEPADHEGGTA